MEKLSAATTEPQPRRRLHQVYPSESCETETDVDIIAIHGLDTKSPDTWLWRDKQRPEAPPVDWLRDQQMLPSVVGNARIFTCDWPADLFESPDMLQRTIGEFALCLLSSIKGRPAARRGGGRHVGPDELPIVFVASCLGGIILLKALSMAQSGGEYRSVLTGTRGVVFLATPFRGTSFQDVAEWAEPGLRIWASIRGQKVSNLLENVKRPTFDLGDLVHGFADLQREHGYQISTFYELGYTNLYDKVGWLGSLFLRPTRKQVGTRWKTDAFGLQHWFLITSSWSTEHLGR